VGVIVAAGLGGVAVGATIMLRIAVEAVCVLFSALADHRTAASTPNMLKANRVAPSKTLRLNKLLIA
jgi:hypothetical protein